jgi:hypothetical protein
VGKGWEGPIVVHFEKGMGHPRLDYCVHGERIGLCIQV